MTAIGTESAALLRLSQFALDNSPEAVFWIGRDAQFLYVNEAACRSLGYSRDELLRMSVHEISARDTRAIWPQLWDKLAREGRLLHESSHRRRNGSVFPVEIAVHYVVFDGRELVCANARDITERKLTEQALHRSEEVYRSYFEMGLVGMAISSSEMRWIEVNERLCEMLGFTRHELLHMTWSDLTCPDDLARSTELFNRLVSGEMGRYSLEKRFIRKDGKTLLCEVWVRAVRRQDGHIDYTIAEIRDITESRRAEHELRLLANAMRSIREAVSITDLEDRILLVNDAFCRTFGYTEQELIGKSISIVRSSRNPTEAVTGILPATLAGGWQGELWNRRKDGSDFPISLSTAAVRDDAGAPVALIGVASDITERHRIEAERQELQAQLLQAQKMEAVGRLAGGIAHDFNNLLTVINGYSDLLLNTSAPSDPVHGSLTEIRKAGERASSLTRQLLVFSRKQSMEQTVLDLNDTIRDIEEMLRRIIGSEVELSMVLDSGDCRVKADPGQIMQVLLNLVVNGRDAMPSGGQLTIRTSRFSVEDSDPQGPDLMPGPYVLIEITDTGAGMNCETMSHLFEPFFTTKQPGQGTGLGLSTVFGIVKQSGGHIDVRSAPGKGTTFRVFLPRIREQASESKAASAPADTLGGGETVLVVEDEPEVRHFVVEVLRRYGYTIIEAASGVEALQICREHSGTIDLMVSDVVMPGMSGRDLATGVTPLRGSMKILLISGYPGGSDAREIVSATGAAYLQKPFTPRELATRVREVLGRKRAKGRVLIVDDESSVRRLLATVLHEDGFDVVEASNGKEALAVVENEQIDLLLTDLVMPEKEGLETIRELKRLRPQLKSIAMSGAFGGRFLEIAKLFGARATIAKPIAPAELLEIVRREMR
jgi:two-component system, cell cycle sensor histidine kinase and response regulator CckA